jgi:hypothetical protein
MVDCVKCICQVHVEEIDVPIELASVFQAVDKALQLARGALSGAEALLCIADDVVLLCEVCEDHCYEASPEFVDGRMQSNRSFVGEVTRVILFV